MACFVVLCRHGVAAPPVDANYNHATESPTHNNNIYHLPGPLTRNAIHRHKPTNHHVQSLEPITEDKIRERPIKHNIRYLDCIWFQRWFMPWQPQPKRWRLWFVCDCAGILAAAFTWLLIVFGEVCLIITILVPFHNRPYAIFSGLLNIFWAFLAFVSHLKAMFVDPVSSMFEC